MEKGKCRLRSLQFLAIAISFLMAIVVFPPSYFLGGNAVHAQTCVKSTDPTTGLPVVIGTCIDTGKLCVDDSNCVTTIPTAPPPSSPATKSSTPDFTQCLNRICGGAIPGKSCSANTDCIGGTATTTTAQNNVDAKLAVLAVGAAAIALVAAYTFTLPATTKAGDWSDPRAIGKVPVRKNPYLCERPGNYTLSAKLDTTNAVSLESGKPLYTSGSRVTVNGEVEALSATCSGLELNCSEQRVQVCKVDRIFMGYELKYQDCPKGFTQLHAEGARKERSVLGIVLLVVSLVAAVFTASAALGVLGTTIGGLTAAKAAAIATLVGTASSIGSGIAANSVANSIDNKPCFNVCGKDYKSHDPSNPFCDKGGPVLGYKAVEYSCSQASCGPARSKKVSIDVKSGEGSRIQRADTSTDALGSFSYTFNAPPQDGDFFVFVKVPK
ncbi:MAG: hypothetical protein HY513_04835 [Candidatus Aenigmarchaeota archaeon]|nr:hypothetical protein [Candidatus Aenigmarchaeota archaeon]